MLKANTKEPITLNKDTYKNIGAKYNEIMELITGKYGEVDFQSSGGALLVQKEGVIIGLVNRKNIDKWENIIDTKLQIIKRTPNVSSIVDESNISSANH